MWWLNASCTNEDEATIETTFVVPAFYCDLIFTAHKRSLRRLCFYTCLSVHSGRGSTWAGTPQAGTPPWAGTPPTGTPPGSSACWEMRAIRILLECILVHFCDCLFTVYLSSIRRCIVGMSAPAHQYARLGRRGGDGAHQGGAVTQIRATAYSTTGKYT